MLPLVTILLQTVGPVLARLIPDPKAQAEAQAEIISKLTEQEAAINDAMAKVMTADAASESPLTRNARPMVVYWCLVMITVWIAAALCGAGPALVTAFAGIPEQLWTLVQIGIGGYMAARAGEKIVTGLKK